MMVSGNNFAHLRHIRQQEKIAWVTKDLNTNNYTKENLVSLHKSKNKNYGGGLNKKIIKNKILRISTGPIYLQTD